MTSDKPCSLTIRIDATSQANLDKLLEVALFELRAVVDKARDVGDVQTLDMAGSMGRYAVEHIKGTREVAALREKLIADGFSYGSQYWQTGEYATYFKEGAAFRFRLHFSPPRLEEVASDVDEPF
jgi:hypothetical protein